MTREEIQLMVAIFEAEDTAGQALEKLKQAQKAHTLAVAAAAVVCRDQQGKLEINETADPGGRRGALVGGMIGAAIGLLGGPVGAIVAGAAGAAVGGVIAWVIDSGIPDPSLRAIGQSLMPGNSAVVVIEDERWQGHAAQLMTAAGGRVLTGSLTSVIARQLELPETSLAESVVEPAASSPAGLDRDPS
jgi:uncharacterized membrane protein